MANIFFDFSGASSVERNLKSIQNTMGDVSQKTSKVYSALSSHSDLMSAMDKNQVASVNNAANKAKQLQETMGQLASVAHDAQEEFSTTDQKKLKLLGGAALSAILSHPVGIFAAGTFFSWLWKTITRGGKTTGQTKGSSNTHVVYDEPIGPVKETSQRSSHPFSLEEDVSNYDNGVIRGKIRYCNQNPSYSSDNGWFAEDSPGCRGYCNSAAASMALSYLGIDKSPSEVRRSDFNHGNTIKLYGTSTTEIADGTKTQIEVAGSKGFSRNRIDQLVAQFESDKGSGNYSPVLLHYDKVIDGQYKSHWILLTGKNEDGSYQAIGPWSNSGSDGERLGFSVNINDNGVVSGSGFSGSTQGRTVSDIVQYHRQDFDWDTIDRES